MQSKTIQRIALLLLALSTLGLAAGCEEKGALERAGESMDDAMEEARDQAEEAADEVEDQLDN